MSGPVDGQSTDAGLTRVEAAVDVPEAWGMGRCVNLEDAVGSLAGSKATGIRKGVSRFDFGFSPFAANRFARVPIGFATAGYPLG